MQTNTVRSSVGNAYQSRDTSGSNNIMPRLAPPHVTQRHWELCNAQERQRLLDARPDTGAGVANPKDNPLPSSDHAWGGMAFGTGQGALNHSRSIFEKYPAHFSQEWVFSRSAVTKKGGSSKPLARKLDDSGIKHNGRNAPHEVPRGSIGKNQPGMTLGQINNHNGAVAESALAHSLEKKAMT